MRIIRLGAAILFEFVTPTGVRIHTYTLCSYRYTRYMEKKKRKKDRFIYYCRYDYAGIIILSNYKFERPATVFE